MKSKNYRKKNICTFFDIVVVRLSKFGGCGFASMCNEIENSLQCLLFTNTELI